MFARARWHRPGLLRRRRGRGPRRGEPHHVGPACVATAGAGARDV